jgi:hypothetical protein
MKRLPPLRHFAYVLVTIWVISGIIALFGGVNLSPLMLLIFFSVITVAGVISVLSQTY